MMAWLLLPLGAALGWYLATRQSVSAQARALADSRNGNPSAMPEWWSNEDPDAAIGALLEATDAGSADMQCSLGILFRKRGQVDRALRLHEAVDAREDLKPELRIRNRFELAVDYAAAGVMDRAEAHFQQLAAEGIRTADSLNALRGLYEQGNDWEQALEVNERLQAVTATDRRSISAHHCCELGELALRAGELADAERWIRRASDLDPDGVRCAILRGQLADRLQRPKDAVESYSDVARCDVRYLGEVIEPLWKAHEALGDTAGFVDFLAEHGAPAGPPRVVLKQLDLLKDSGLPTMPLLVESFTARPGWVLLERLCADLDLAPDSPYHAAVAALREALGQAAARRPRYHCSSCGMQPGILFWQCPSCREWGRIAPANEAISPG